MNDDLREISDRIPGLAKAALAQANQHAVFMDPGNEHWPSMSVLNAAHAGELFLKAIIAREHPLLIFRDLAHLDDRNAVELDLQGLLSRGRTHDFDKLPQVLWATTGLRIPDTECYEQLRQARNAIQHFCLPAHRDLSELSLKFIYRIIDPLIAERFDLYAIEHHEDHSIGYDYVVGCLMRHQLRFSVPKDFSVSEIDLVEELKGASEDYRSWFHSALVRIGKGRLVER